MKKITTNTTATIMTLAHASTSTSTSSPDTVCVVVAQQSSSHHHRERKKKKKKQATTTISSTKRIEKMRFLLLLLFSTPSSVLGWVLVPHPSASTTSIPPYRTLTTFHHKRSRSSSSSFPSSLLHMISSQQQEQEQNGDRVNGRSSSAIRVNWMEEDDAAYYPATNDASSSDSSAQVEDVRVEDESPIRLNALLVWCLPLVNMMGAFFFYTNTQFWFHNFMDYFSGHLWINVDGNMYMSEIVKPVLNGPVTLSISILFGTLISMTIQTLYRRQISLHQTLISTVEEVRELQWLVEGFPEPYKAQSHTLLGQFLSRSFQDFENQSVTPESLRTKEMTQMLLLLNDLSLQENSPDIIVCEAYGCVHRLKDRRAEFMSGLQTIFSTAHYVVIGLLAATLLFVFLLETDNDTLQFLLDFQLSICWALLIGSYSMLAAIIYDLSRPFTGVFTVMKGVNFVANEKANKIVTTTEVNDDLNNPDITLGATTTTAVLDEEWRMSLIMKQQQNQNGNQEPEECDIDAEEAEWC